MKEVTNAVELNVNSTRGTVTGVAGLNLNLELQAAVDAQHGHWSEAVS